MGLTKGQYYSLKRFLAGKHTGRYDHKGYREVFGNNRVNPEGGAKAWHAVAYALKIGILVRQNCQYCDDPDSDAHHHKGYDHPLDVLWLCQPCHQRLENENEAGLAIVKGEQNGNAPEGA